MQHSTDPMRSAHPTIRRPSAADGPEIWNLVRACKPLDENSMYCNLLQSDHFADTCSLAELSQQTVGWVSAYVMPNAPDTLFVWQVASGGSGPRPWAWENDAAVHSAAVPV